MTASTPPGEAAPGPDAQHPPHWYLESLVPAADGGGWRSLIDSLPCRIGREPGVSLWVDGDAVSQRHAEIFARDGELWIRDLGSTNGTWVNFVRLEGSTRLRAGDVVHFGDLGLRLATSAPGRPRPRDTRRLVTGPMDGFEPDRRGLLEMLRQRAVRAVFQPIVPLAGGAPIGYEILGRGNLAGVDASPAVLLSLAERMGLERELCEAFRERGLTAAARMPGDPLFFLNTHPSELLDSEPLLASLRRLRRELAPLRLAVEVHESAATNPGSMRRLKQSLAELGVALAFDDFGTGCCRMRELYEAPPDYLKLDMSFTRGLHRAPGARRDLLANLLAAARQLGVTPIAEGVETAEELEACRDIGFDFAQGYLLGTPTAAESLAGEA